MTGNACSTRCWPIVIAVIAAFCLGAPAEAQKGDDPKLSLSPPRLEFGGVEVGVVKTRATKIRNKGGGELEITAIALCAGTSAEFSFSPPAVTTLAPKESLSLQVSYAPTGVGADSGCLTISSNDPKSPTVELALRGKGVEDDEETTGPDIDLKPDSLDFGQVVIAGSKTLSVKVKNKGTEPLQGVMIGRGCFPTSEEFTWTPTDMFSVPPDDNVKIQVTYSPVDEGEDEGCLEIVSNDPDENPAVLAVRGLGVEAVEGVVDIDIHDFKVRRKIRLRSTQQAKPQLWVKSVGDVDEPRPAIVIGMQNGEVVYDEEIMVSDRGGNQGKTKYRFPSYTPTEAGEILWMATVVDDNDDDIDESMAVTQVLDQVATSDGFDLDPVKLKATKRVSLSSPRPIRVRVWLMNNGTLDQTGAVTLTGTQGGVEVFSETITDVSDAPGDGAATRYEFTWYTLEATGDILWSVDVADGDADDDVMSAVTRVGS